MVAEAQSVSEALGVPLYRAGDNIAKVEPTPEEISEKERQDAAVDAATAAWLEGEGGEGEDDEEEYDELEGRVFEVGVAEYREGDSGRGYDDGGEGEHLAEGRAFQAGIAQYDEGPLPPEEREAPEVSFWEERA